MSSPSASFCRILEALTTVSLWGIRRTAWGRILLFCARICRRYHTASLSLGERVYPASFASLSYSAAAPVSGSAFSLCCIHSPVSGRSSQAAHRVSISMSPVSLPKHSLSAPNPPATAIPPAAKASPPAAHQGYGNSTTRSAPFSSRICALVYLSRTAGIPRWTKFPLMTAVQMPLFLAFTVSKRYLCPL